MHKYEILDNNSLTQLSTILGEYLTGSQITNFFHQVGYDECSTITKRIRINDFFIYVQRQYGCSNKVLEFISMIANPINYINNQEQFLHLINDLNNILSFSGITINEKGQFLKTSKATTITEAKSKANHLRKILFDRNIHEDILKFCKPELIENNYFHAVFEATKSVANKLRDKSGLTLDGNQLVYAIFNKDKPILAINSLRTFSEINEQNGFKNLLIGIFSMFRNTTAHEAKIYWSISEQDAIDLLTTLSFIHRKLDISVKIPY